MLVSIHLNEKNVSPGSAKAAQELKGTAQFVSVTIFLAFRGDLI
jgi:hypothetical protein